MTDDPRERRRRAILAEVASIGLTFPIAVLVGYFVGGWLGGLVGFDRIGKMIGIFLGFASALVPVFLLERRTAKNENDRKP